MIEDALALTLGVGRVSIRAADLEKKKNQFARLELEENPCGLERGKGKRESRYDELFTSVAAAAMIGASQMRLTFKESCLA